MENTLKSLFGRYGILIILGLICLVFCVTNTFIFVEAKEDFIENPISNIIAEDGAGEGQDGGSSTGGSGIDGDIAFALEDSGMDENLYSALLAIYNEEKGIANSPESAGFLRTKMFLEDDINITCLDLSGRDITSLTNFNWMYFKSNLTEIRLDNNHITSIAQTNGVTPFVKVGVNLKTLSITNNGLNSIDLTGLTSITNLNLSCNGIETIDLSSIRTNEEEVSIDLSVNGFEEYEKIILPNDADLVNKLNINLMGNNLPDQDSSLTNINLILALQGVNGIDEAKLTTLDKLYYYKTGIENLMLVITLNDSNIAPTIIYDSQVEGKRDLVELLGVGNYSAYYSNNASTLESLYDEDSFITYAYKPQTFKIMPNAPTFKLEYNGEVVELDSIKELDRPATLYFYATDDGAETYYKMPNTSEWVKADKVDITRGGKYTIMLKTVVKDVDGNEVESAYSYALIQARLNLYMPNLVLLLLIAAFAILFFAVVLPLIKKYIMHN